MMAQNGICSLDVGYTPQEKQSFWVHTLFAVACLPLYYFVPTLFGLVISPYLLYLALAPKPQYLLPVVLHMAYGSQQRYFFCMGCFIYALMHYDQLVRLSLHLIFCIYLAILPFFIWYLFQKINGPKWVGGIGEVTGGIGQYFVFSTVFWGALAINKIDRLFYRGFLVFSLMLILVVSLKSGNAGSPLQENGGARSLFSRELFFSIPFACGMFWYSLTAKRLDLRFELMLSGLCTVIFFLDFVGLLRYSTTFTQLGSLLFTVFMIVVGRRMKNAYRWLNMFWFMLLSLVVVLVSARLVEKYGGLYDTSVRYEEIKRTDFSSLIEKLQRKAVDDRAQVWNVTIEHIKRMWKKKPIWIDISPYAEATVYVPGRGFVEIQMDMSSHNTMLELLRQYGFYGGLGLYVVFVLCFCRKINVQFLFQQQKSCHVVLMATCLSQAAVGGHTGHYPVLLTFGPVLFSCLGACWRIAHESQRQMFVVSMY